MKFLLSFIIPSEPHNSRSCLFLLYITFKEIKLNLYTVISAYNKKTEDFINFLNNNFHNT